MSAGATTRRVGTFAYLPPLSDEEIGLQVRAILGRGLVPGIEFASDPRPRDSYWGLWKLPLFDVRSAGKVLTEIAACAAANPNSYVKLVGYDPHLQSQVISLLVRRPPGAP